MTMEENQINIKRVEPNTGVKKSVNTSSPSVFARLFMFLLIVGIGVLGFLYYKTDKELKLLKEPEAQTAYLKQEIEKITKDIGKVVMFPDDDRLVYVGTVEDPEILKKEQSFFANASVGDYIFVFEKTGRALLWNTQKNIIVNFGVASNPEETKMPSPEVKATQTAPKKAQ